MLIENFSVVKLTRPTYIKEQIEDCKETAPRVLVIKTFPDTAQCQVRYPNGFIHRVDYQNIIVRCVFDKTHPTYPKLILDMYSAVIEYNKNHTFRAFLEQHHPATAIELAQKVAVRNERWAKENPSSTIATKVETPVKATPDDTIKLLTSIDNKLEILIRLWGGEHV